MNPLIELFVGVVLAAGAVFFVLRPIFSPALQHAPAAAEDEAPDPEDDLSPRTVALRALKEIEFDRATGKLADADYDALKAKYTAEALAALREAPAAAAKSAAPSPSSGASRAVAGKRACPTHGPRPEAEAEFCSECGRRLAAAAGYCARCGTMLKPDARFCERCGGRVAA